jgi:hypothetical protein
VPAFVLWALIHHRSPLFAVEPKGYDAAASSEVVAGDRRQCVLRVAGSTSPRAGGPTRWLFSGQGLDAAVS